MAGPFRGITRPVPASVFVTPTVSVFQEVNLPPAQRLDLAAAHPIPTDAESCFEVRSSAQVRSGDKGNRVVWGHG
jgi:hypothetical protein